MKVGFSNLKLGAMTLDAVNTFHYYQTKYKKEKESSHQELESIQKVIAQFMYVFYGTQYVTAFIFVEWPVGR